MNRLLSANFMRLFKSKIFWLGMLFMFGLAWFVILARFYEMRKYPDIFEQISSDQLLFAAGIYVPIVIAIFIGVFIGTEYNDGTIRNKLIVGRSRITVYLSNLIVCTAASLMMHVIYIAVIVCAGIPLLGSFAAGADTLLLFFLCSLAAVTAFAAIFILISMLITSKSTGSIAAIVMSIVLIMASVTINQRLEAPEYYDSYTWTDQTGVTHYEEAEKNPHYLTGTKRKVYEELNDILPSSQLLQITGRTELPDDFAKLPLYSFSIIAVSTAAGIILFRRRDLK